MAIRDLIPWNWGARNVPIKRLPDQPGPQLRRGGDDLFDDFFDNFALAPFGAFEERFGSFMPQIDVSETDQEIKVAVELPGMSEDDIEVSLDRNMLTISGEKKDETEEKGENFYRMERSYGKFRRSIPLPAEVQADQVEATFKQGVLHVTLPRTEPSTVKKIEIKQT